MISEEDQVRQR